VERSFAWATRCRRLVKDYERYAQTLAGFHVIAFVGYMLKQVAAMIQSACRIFGRQQSSTSTKNRVSPMRACRIIRAGRPRIAHSAMSGAPRFRLITSTE
jgi:hypothetical protein